MFCGVDRAAESLVLCGARHLDTVEFEFSGVLVGDNALGLRLGTAVNMNNRTTVIQSLIQNSTKLFSIKLGIKSNPVCSSMK